jgi:DNA (cytosine-5)-methyltransferase 1
MVLSSVEICAGGGGQALGLEQAGFHHELVAEIDLDAASTLAANRPKWNVICGDVRELNGADFRGVDLFAGGVPCPPFSVAGNQLGRDDERDLFPEALRLVRESRPRAVLLENVRGLASARFAVYRNQIRETLASFGYRSHWQLIFASEHGVPQLRPRFVLVAMLDKYFDDFHWPAPEASPTTVGDVLHGQMSANGWPGAPAWAQGAQGIGPTVVGGSRKHGGADLGPSRAKEGWLKLGVDGRGIADDAPTQIHPVKHIPRLTLPMVARIQGFPSDWQFEGRKTSVYRQIGNAFPPPVAESLGSKIAAALRANSRPVQQLTLPSAAQS